MKLTLRLSMQIEREIECSKVAELKAKELKLKAGGTSGRKLKAVVHIERERLKLACKATMGRWKHKWKWKIEAHS